MAQRKQWSDLTRAQQSASIAVVVVQIVLMVAALVDIRRRSPAQIHGSKRLWTAAAFVNFVGPITYFVFGRKR